jgi:hypothetical protein
MQVQRIPVKVLDDLMREVIRWIEAHRPIGVDRDEAVSWVLSAAFSSVSVAGAACAGLQALGGEVTEEEFLDLAREAYRRAHRSAPEASA